MGLCGVECTRRTRLGPISGRAFAACTPRAAAAASDVASLIATGVAIQRCSRGRLGVRMAPPECVSTKRRNHLCSVRQEFQEGCEYTHAADCGGG